MDCERHRPGQHNRLQERFNALTRDKNLLENRNTELTNMIKDVEEERDRLKIKLSGEKKSLVTVTLVPLHFFVCHSDVK